MDKNKANEILNKLYYDEMNFCGCYDPDIVMKKIQNSLNDLEHKPYTDEEVIWLYQLDAWGLTTHGTIISGSWLTEKGEEVKEALNHRTGTWYE